MTAESTDTDTDTARKMMTSTRVLRGDVRCAYGRDYVVVSTRRASHGVEVVVGELTREGVVQTRETRTYGTVQGWSRKGRMRISVAPSGGYYAAPWRGSVAGLWPAAE